MVGVVTVTSQGRWAAQRQCQIKRHSVAQAPGYGQLSTEPLAREGDTNAVC